MKNIFNLSIFKKSESVTGNKYVLTPFRLRLNIVLSVLLMMFSVSAWGTEVTFTWGTNPSAYESGSSDFYEGDVHFVGGNNSGNTETRAWSDGLRIYNGGTATFTAPAGCKITSITGYTAFNYSNATGENSVTFTGLSKTTCKSDVTVTYTGGGGTTYTVTLSKNGSTSEITGCSGTYTLPTTGEHVANACEGWEWHCWTNAAYSTGSPTTTAPSSTKITTMNSAGTAYAVYKHTEASGGSSNVTFTAGTDKGSTTSTNADEMTKGGITISSTSAALAYDDNYRLYSSSTTTISSSSGNITSIVLNSTASGTSKYGPAKLSGTGYSYSGSVGTWTGNAASVTLSASDQFRATSIVVTTGGGTTTTYTSAPPCTTYEVSATTNNASWGTATVDHYTITAHPADGYIADGYTVTAGTATVTQTGNTYNVSPSEDCTVQINFRAAATYTITINDNGTTYNETAYEGVPYDLPDEGLSTCPDATLLGWATGTYTNHATGTSVEPTYDAPGSSKNITANTTFTAVYGTVAPSDNYAALKLESDLESGANYVLAAYSSGSDYAMKATMSNDRVDTEVKSLTLDAAGNAITDSYLIWQINVVNPSTKAVTFYNAEINKYLVINGSNELTFADDPIVFNYTVNTSGSAATWNFKSSSNAEYTLSFYTTYHQFNAYTSNSTNLYLYKQKIEVSNYTSKPQCCHAPGTPLGISSETTNFIGSGSTTISLTGGNGQPITWTCKDEANIDRSSYLSGKSNTGATLTLPTNAATKVYTVTATQADDETDPDNVICGATVTLNFTVKAQFTINFKTVDGGSESLYNSITVTDGDTYEMPSLAEDFDCGTSGKSFMGWASTNNATSVDKTAGSNVTATAAATWYACWATSADVTSVPLYEKVTSTSSLAAGNYVLICNTGATVAMAGQEDNNRNQASVTSYVEDDIEYVYYTGTDVRELTVGKSGDYFTFRDAVQGGYLYAASGSKNYLRTQATNNANGEWTLVIADNGAATVTAHGDNSHNIMRYNTSNHIFSCYSSGQQAVVFYKKTGKTKAISTGSGSITTDIDGCTSGPTIRANTNQWITAAAGQKVKTVIEVTAKSFESATTLSAISSNSKFEVSLAATAVPAGVTGLTTSLTVEYTPTESDVTESSTITLTAGDITKTIIVNGRSLPDEFLLITKKTLWYALPANMNNGPGEYDGVVVTPDDGETPTMVNIAPSTVLYSLQAVTSDRYNSHGTCVRLVGYNSLCLWSNLATTTSKTHIQNKTNVATATGDNFEWLLTTTDGMQYTIANPNHPQYGAGRRLAYVEKFGLYAEPTIFYIVPAGCSSQPGEVSVGARRVDATFAWVSNTTEMHIDIWTNEAKTEGHLSATASSSPFVFTGLEETTDYWYTLTPGTDVACAVSGSFTTSGPIIDIVEWQENGVVLYIDKGDIDPLIVIDGQEEHGSITGGGTATELFFAKYFEGAGSMKLLSIFNGTKEAISLSNYKFVDRHASDGATSFGDSKEYDLSSLGDIKAGQEIIFFSRPLSSEAALSACSTDFLNEVAELNNPDDNPRWIECASGKFADKVINFNGNDALLLKKGDDIIDVIGAINTPGQGSNCKDEDAWEGTIKNMDNGKSPSDPAFDAFFEASSLSPVTRADSIAILTAFGINLSDDEIEIPTARCIFFRDKRVTSGDSAVLMNTDDFVTFTNHTEGGQNYKAEWYGRSVCMTLSAANKAAAGVTNDAQATCNSYQDIANMDYNKYYIDWTQIGESKELSKYTSDPSTKEYTIPITDMRQYACLKLRFQLKKDDEVITEAAQQVPIVVAANADTNDPLFSELVIDKVDEKDPSTWIPSYSESVARCKTCDVVILNDVTLTKGSDTDPKDIDEIGNLKIYPGGKLIVPSSTTYNVKSLAFRRQEDAVASANIQGTLNIGNTNGVYFDLRVDPTNWHYISLPYDCNVSDIRFANPEETAVPVLGTDFLLMSYNGARRAAEPMGQSWDNVPADATLKKGLGYIYSLPGEEKVKREIRFPMSNDVIPEDLGNKTIGQVFGHGCDKSDTELRPNNKGWNLIGDPYLMPYETDITNPLRTGKLVHTPDPWDGTWMIEDNDETRHVHYIVEPIDNGWSGYRQVTIYDYPMIPFTCYFVQIGGSNPEAGQDLDFTGSQVIRESIVRRAPREYSEEEDTHPVWCAVDITNTLGETDETTLLISNNFTDNYDMMNDLVKMRGSYYTYYTRPVIASRNNDGEMAFNALPDASAAAGVPLNYFAASTGEYTIAYNDKFGREEIKAVMLNDKQTGQWIDLMEDSYTFASNRMDNDDRFILVVRVERKKTPEGITNIESLYNGTEEGPMKLLINGHVYIQRGGQLYDITGKQVLKN